MSTKIMAACWPLKLPMAAKSVLISLADNANDDGACWPSIDLIAERTCCHRVTVIRAIETLEQYGCLAADRSNGRHTRYRVTPESYREPVAESDRSERANQLQKVTGSAVQPVAESYGTSCRELPDPLHKVTGPVAQSNTNHQGTVKEPSGNRQRVRKPAREADPDLPDWLSAEAWAMWDRHRKALGKGWTADAKHLTIATLAKLRDAGNDPREVIAQSVEAGWRGLFAVKPDRQPASSGQRQSANQSAAQAAKKLIFKGSSQEVIDYV